MKKGLEFVFLKILWPVIRPISGLLLKAFILPFYRLVVLTKLRIQRLALPARGFVLFFVTNRYLFHVAILAASIVTIWVNIQTHQVLAQDIGKHSLLYTLMTQGESEIMTEQALADGTKPDQNRFGQGTIEALPNIDFDYQTVDDQMDQSLSFNIPGTIVLAPTDRTGQEGEQVHPKRQSVESYVVKENETLGSIARDFDINVGTLLWANNLTERQYIRPGDTLKILPVSGVLATVKKGDTLLALANRYGGDTEEIIRQNNLTEGKITAGMDLVIPGGQPAEIEITRTLVASRRTAAVTNDRLSEPGASREVGVDTNPISKPADAKEKPESPKTRLLWPTNGHVITQYYGWRHTGLDIDGDFTSPLYAADDGVVSQAGWNSGGYGLMVLIDHPNGMRTRYGHASKLFVKAGDTVRRGQVIAMMGSTGRSTGSHLHFEVYVSGKRTNPLLYIR